MRAADFLYADVLSGGYVGVAFCVFYGAAVGVAVASSVVVRASFSFVSWRLA